MRANDYIVQLETMLLVFLNGVVYSLFVLSSAKDSNNHF